MTLMMLMTMLVKHIAVDHFSDYNGSSLDDDDDDDKYHIGNVDNSVMITITTTVTIISDGSRHHGDVTLILVMRKAEIVTPMMQP